MKDDMPLKKQKPINYVLCCKSNKKKCEAYLDIMILIKEIGATFGLTPVYLDGAPH